MKRGAPLQRHTALTATKPLSPGSKPLARRTPLRQSGTPVVVPHVDFETPTGNPQVETRTGYGLSRIGFSPRKPRKETGPSRKVRLLVLERDGYACICCGLSVIGQRYAIQHRDARGMGGTSDPKANSPVNLLTMLEEHHLRVESRQDPHDNAKGYWLRMGEDAALTPVMYFSEGGGGFTAWLLANGSLSFDGPGEAVA